MSTFPTAWNAPVPLGQLEDPLARFYDNMIAPGLVLKDPQNPAVTRPIWNTRAAETGHSPLGTDKEPDDAYQARVLMLRQASWRLANSVSGMQHGVTHCYPVAPGVTSGSQAVVFLTPFDTSPTIILGSLMYGAYGDVSGTGTYVTLVTPIGFTINWTGASASWYGGADQASFYIAWSAFGSLGAPSGAST